MKNCISPENGVIATLQVQEYTLYFLLHGQKDSSTAGHGS
eukprot:SAG31_NODE_20775_length_565_cov_1.427039_2_plen_40_part_01